LEAKLEDLERRVDERLGQGSDPFITLPDFFNYLISAVGVGLAAVAVIVGYLLDKVFTDRERRAMSRLTALADERVSELRAKFEDRALAIQSVLHGRMAYDDYLRFSELHAFRSPSGSPDAANAGQLLKRAIASAERSYDLLRGEISEAGREQRLAGALNNLVYFLVEQHRRPECRGREWERRHIRELAGDLEHLAEPGRSNALPCPDSHTWYETVQYARYWTAASDEERKQALYCMKELLGGTVFPSAPLWWRIRVYPDWKGEFQRAEIDTREPRK